VNDLELTVRLTADGSGLRGELRVSKEDIKKLKGELDDAGTEARQAADKLDKYGKEAGQAGRASRKLRRETHGVTVAMKSLRGMIGGLGLYAVAKSMLVSISAMQGLRSRLTDLVGGTREYNQENEYLIELAQRMSADLSTLRESYSRTLTLEKAGILTRQEAREITEGMINIQTRLGASAAQLNQAMFGLSQGMSSGTLRAEELNQVTEPLPGLLQELDKAAGLASGGFRRMVNEGKVTSSFFKTTLIKALNEYEGAAESMSGNLSQMWTRVKNEYRLLMEVFEQPVSFVVGAALDGLEVSLKKLRGSIEWLKEEALPLLRDSVIDNIGAIQKAWDWMKTTTLVVWESIHLAAVKSVNAVRDKMGDMYLSLSKAASALGFDDLSNSLFSAAANMQSFGNTAGQIEQRIKTLRKEHDQYVKTVDANVAEYKKWNWETSHQAKSLDDVLKGLKKDTTATTANTKAKGALEKQQKDIQKQFVGTLQALAIEYVRLTEGERAAYEHTLAMKGWNDAQIEAAMVAWDVNHALQAQKEEMEKAAKANAETSGEFQKVWENAISSVDNIFRDLWRGAFDSAKDFGQSLKEWFANLLAELAHQALTRPIVLSIGAMFSGGPGTSMAGQAGQSLLGGQGGFGSVFGKLGSFLGSDSIAMTLNRGMGLFNGGSGVGAGFVGPPSPGVNPVFGGSNLGYGLSGIGGGLIGHFLGGDKYGSMVGGLGGMLGYGLATGGTALGAGAGAMWGAWAGPIGMVIGAVLASLISKFTEQGEAPTQFKLWGNAGAIDPQNSKFNGEDGRFDYKTTGALTEFYHKGVRSRIQMDTAFGALGAGIQHVGNDGQLSDEDAQKYLDQFVQIFDGIRMMDGALAELIGDDKLGQVTDALSHFGEELSSKKPEDINKFLKARYDVIFDTIGGEMDAIYDAMVKVSSGTDMTEIIGQVTAFFSTLEGYKNIFSDYDEMVRQAGLTQTEAMAEFTAGLYDQIAAYDGSIEANRTITAGLQQRYQMELQYLAAIDAAQQSVTATLGKSIEAIRLSQMTDQQRYEYQKQQAEALAASLATMTDPAQITQTVNEINRLTMAAWNSLSDEQKAQVAGGFEEFLGAVDERANAQLDKAREAVQQEHDMLVQAYTDMAAAARELADAVGVDPVAPADPGEQKDQNPIDKFDLFNSGAQTFDEAVGKFAELINRFAGGAEKIEQAANTPVQVHNVIELLDNGGLEVG
jgi:tape measure domain-containing protein